MPGARKKGLPLHATALFVVRLAWFVCRSFKFELKKEAAHKGNILHAATSSVCIGFSKIS